jgi:hypothetical protein
MNALVPRLHEPMAPAPDEGSGLAQSTIAAAVTPPAKYSPKQRLLAAAERMVYRAAGLPVALRMLFARDTREPEMPVQVIQRHFARSFWTVRRRNHWMDFAAAVLIWPIAVPVTAAIYTWRNGRITQARFGKSPFAQFREQLRFAIKGVLPPWYYVFEFYDDQKKKNAASYLHRYQTKLGMYEQLTGPASSPLSNKYEFARWLDRAGVHAVQPVVLARNGGLITTDGQAPTLPAADLFLKPQRARGGKGAERWDFRAGHYHHAGTALDETKLLEHLKLKSAHGNWLVQRRLLNHPALLDLANEALATVRVVTLLNEAGEPEVTNAVFRMAIGDNHVVDNIHAGGIAAAVELRTGRLSAATNIGMDATLGWLDRHPTSGAAITGRIIPHWEAVLALSCQAHNTMRDRFIVGWDIAVLKDGPCVIEGNSGPCVDLIQRPHGTPLGESRFGALLAHRIRQYNSRTDA